MAQDDDDQKLWDEMQRMYDEIFDMTNSVNTPDLAQLDRLVTRFRDYLWQHSPEIARCQMGQSVSDHAAVVVSLQKMWHWKESVRLHGVNCRQELTRMRQSLDDMVEGRVPMDTPGARDRLSREYKQFQKFIKDNQQAFKEQGLEEWADALHTHFLHTQTLPRAHYSKPAPAAPPMDTWEADEEEVMDVEGVGAEEMEVGDESEDEEVPLPPDFEYNSGDEANVRQEVVNQTLLAVDEAQALINEAQGLFDQILEWHGWGHYDGHIVWSGRLDRWPALVDRMARTPTLLLRIWYRQRQLIPQLEVNRKRVSAQDLNAARDGLANELRTAVQRMRDMDDNLHLYALEAEQLNRCRLDWWAFNTTNRVTAAAGPAGPQPDMPLNHTNYPNYMNADGSCDCPECRQQNGEDPFPDEVEATWTAEDGPPEWFDLSDDELQRSIDERIGYPEEHQDDSPNGDGGGGPGAGFPGLAYEDVIRGGLAGTGRGHSYRVGRARYSGPSSIAESSVMSDASLHDDGGNGGNGGNAGNAGDAGDGGNGGNGGGPEIPVVDLVKEPEPEPGSQSNYGESEVG